MTAERELQELEYRVVHGVKILYRPADPGGEDEDVFRFRTPSHNQAMFADMIMHQKLWELQRKPGLITMQEAEIKYKDEIDSIRKELQALGERADDALDELIKSSPDLPDRDEDKEGFEKGLELMSVNVVNLRNEMLKLEQRKNNLFAYTIEGLAHRTKVAVMTALCWEQYEDGEWKPIWAGGNEEAWAAFSEDRTEIASFLEHHSFLFLMAVPGFFDNLPGLPSGVKHS